MKNIKDLRDAISAVDVDDLGIEESYSTLREIMSDYWSDTGDEIGVDLFDEYIDYDMAEERARYELESGLMRLWCFLGDTDLNRSIYRLDGYSNLQNVDIDDMEILQEELLDAIDEQEERSA